MSSNSFLQTDVKYEAQVTEMELEPKITYFVNEHSPI